MNQIESKSGTVVLLVDEDLEYLESMRRNIQRSGYSVTVCKSYDEGIHQLASGAFDIIFVGQGSRKFEGRCVLQSATALDRHLPVVVVARIVDMGCYLEAMQLGAVDYISPGLWGSEIDWVVQTHGLHRVSRSGSVQPEHSSTPTISARLVA